MYELKKMERYLRVNLLGPDPRLMKKEFTCRGLTKVEKHWARKYILNICSVPLLCPINTSVYVKF